MVRRVGDWGDGEDLPFLRDMVKVEEWLLREEGVQGKECLYRNGKSKALVYGVY